MSGGGSELVSVWMGGVGGYHISGNFRGVKFLRIRSKRLLVGLNFCGWPPV